MDAISFVMGEKTNSLRVKRLGELIHGAAIGRPVSNRCSVTAKFDLDNGTQIEFQRSVINSSADYKVNGKVKQIHRTRLYLRGHINLCPVLYCVGSSKFYVLGAA